MNSSPTSVEKPQTVISRQAHPKSASQADALSCLYVGAVTPHCRCMQMYPDSKSNARDGAVMAISSRRFGCGDRIGTDVRREDDPQLAAWLTCLLPDFGDSLAGSQVAQHWSMIRFRPPHPLMRVLRRRAREELYLSGASILTWRYVCTYIGVVQKEISKWG
jgi:hypothetical protein